MLSRDEKAAAVRRVRAEGQVQLEDLSKQLRVSQTRLRRFIAQGLAGVHLDGIVCAGEWYSSPQAWDRFRALRPAAARSVRTTRPPSPAPSCTARSPQ